MKHRKTILNLIVALIIIGLLVWYIISNWNDFAQLEIVHPIICLPILIFALMSLYASGMVNELTIRPHGVNISKREVFGLAAITRFMNQLMPNYVGASIRAVYYKREHRVSYAKFSSSFLVANLLQLLVSCFIAITAYLVFIRESGEPNTVAIMLLAASLLLILLFMPTRPFSYLLKKLYARFPVKPLERLSVLPEEFSKVRSHPSLLLATVFWMILLTLLTSSILWSLYYLLGSEIPIGAALFIAPFLNLALIVSITPAGLGIREGALLLGAGIVGIPFTFTLALALLLRLVFVIVAGSVSLLFYRKILSKTT